VAKPIAPPTGELSKSKRRLLRPYQGRSPYQVLTPIPDVEPMCPVIPYERPSRGKSKSKKSTSKKSNSSDSKNAHSPAAHSACTRGGDAGASQQGVSRGSRSAALTETPVEVAPLDPSCRPQRYPVAEQGRATKTAEQGIRFAKLYTDNWHFVKRTVERYGVPSRDAPDIAQEVFTVALRRLEDLDVTGSPRPWLWVISMQLVANYRNLARHRVEPISPIDPPEPMSHAIDVESAFLAQEEKKLAHELIGRLSPKLRVVLVKHDLEERAIADIAAELKILPKTAYARLDLARAEVLRRGKSLAAAGLLPAKPVREGDTLAFREISLWYGLYVACSSSDPELEALLLDEGPLDDSFLPDVVDDRAFSMGVAS